MRVCSPHVRATLMPPPLGMCRSHTTRSGLVRRDDGDRLVGVAGLADDVEVRAEVGPDPGSPDRVVVGQHHPHGAGRVSRSTAIAAAVGRSVVRIGSVHGTHSRTSAPRPGRPSTSTRPPTSSMRPRIDRVEPDALGGRGRVEAAPVVLDRAEEAARRPGLDVDRRRGGPPCLAALVSASLTAPPTARATVSSTGGLVGQDHLACAGRGSARPAPTRPAASGRRPGWRDRRRTGTRAARAPARGPGRPARDRPSGAAPPPASGARRRGGCAAPPRGPGPRRSGDSASRSRRAAKPATRAGQGEQHDRAPRATACAPRSTAGTKDRSPSQCSDAQRDAGPGAGPTP